MKKSLRHTARFTACGLSLTLFAGYYPLEIQREAGADILPKRIDDNGGVTI